MSSFDRDGGELLAALRSAIVAASAAAPASQAGGRPAELLRHLHSLKTWALFARRSGLARLCHEWEDRLGELTPDALEQLGLEAAEGGAWENLLMAEPDPEPAAAPGQSSGLWCLGIPALEPDSRGLRMAAAAQRSGGKLRQCRLFVSPEEPWPHNRILIAHQRLERQGVVCAEAWYSGIESVCGPCDPSAVPPAGEWRGGWYRAIYVEGAVPVGSVLAMDLIDTFHDRPWQPDPEAAAAAACRPGALSLVRLDRSHLALQALRCLGDDPAWRGRLLDAIDAEPALPALRAQLAAAEAYARAGGDGCPVRWQLYAEELSLPAVVLTSLCEVLRQLARNALAHARQTPEARQGAGKGAVLRVDFEIAAEPGALCMRYADDGAGPAQSMNWRVAGIDGWMAFQDMAAPLSRRSATLEAGRGAGLMDVARLAAAVLGGSCTVSGVPGAGFSCEIVVPTGLAELAVVPFESEGLRVLPQALVRGLVDLREHRPMPAAGGGWTCPLGGHFLPLPAAWRPDAGLDLALLAVRSGTAGLTLVMASAVLPAEVVVAVPGASRVWLPNAGRPAELAGG